MDDRYEAEAAVRRTEIEKLLGNLPDAANDDEAPAVLSVEDPAPEASEQPVDPANAVALKRRCGKRRFWVSVIAVLAFVLLAVAATAAWFAHDKNGGDSPAQIGLALEKAVRERDAEQLLSLIEPSIRENARYMIGIYNSNSSFSLFDVDTKIEYVDCLVGEDGKIAELLFRATVQPDPNSSIYTGISGALMTCYAYQNDGQWYLLYDWSMRNALQMLGGNITTPTLYSSQGLSSSILIPYPSDSIIIRNQ